MAENKVEFEVEDDPPEIEIVDDTPESDRGRSAKGPVDVSDEEISQYSDNVQKRIKDLRRVYHDERREKERALRENQEAINYAKAISDENRKLQERLVHGEKFLRTMLNSLKQNGSTRTHLRPVTQIR
jgi:hypothetical protein